MNRSGISGCRKCGYIDPDGGGYILFGPNKFCASCAGLLTMLYSYEDLLKQKFDNNRVSNQVKND